MSLKFSYTPLPDGISVVLSQLRTFSRKALPVEKWPAPVDQPVAPAMRFVMRLHEQGIVTVSGDAVFLPTRALTDANGAILTALGLPEIAPLAVGLTLRSRIEAADGRIELRWTDRNMREVTPQRHGMIVAFGGRSGRLAAPVVNLLHAIEAYNATAGQTAEERLASWTPVQRQLDGLGEQPVQPDKLLRTFRIYQAGAFALDVQETAAGLAFDPVPMSRAMRASLDDEAAAPEDGRDPVDETKDQGEQALLPPELQRQFVSAFNKDGLATRPAYVLGRSTYLVIDPDVQVALDVVKSAQRLGEAQRRVFMRNPRAAIVAAMPETGESAGTIFVETKQYSARVTGLGLWEKPTLEWIKRQSASWLPETFQFVIGDNTLQMNADSLENLGSAFDQAQADGLDTFAFEGHVLSVEEAATAFEHFRSELGGQKEAPADTDCVEQDRDVLLIDENIETSDFMRSVVSRPLFVQKVFPSDLVKSEPKPHQIEGFGWLVDSWTAGLPGVLLADDMGLGKTMQSLAFLVWFRDNLQLAGERGKPFGGPILIVAPTALLRNWQKEAELHLQPGALGHCAEVFGRGLSRLKLAGQTPENALDVDALREADWVLTTYETLANYHRAFARVGFSVAVFDEMQKIKAPDTINTHAAKTINADFVLGMTGTPIENRIEDLWCIMDRVAPGLLGALKEFSKRYGDNDADALAELKSTLDQRNGEAPPIMLRRMKHDHLRGLPVRHFKTYGDSHMPQVQADAYQAVVDAAAGGSARGKGEMLKTVHALRGVSLHPQGAAEVDVFDRVSAEQWVDGSARVRQVVLILTTIRAAGEKALVFIEDRAVQTAFSTIIAQRMALPREPEIINGETGADERQAIVDRFQRRGAGFDLLVLSPKAAGIGLTITAANHVIHLSRWWNPAVEDQCNDRVYRIGQEKPVTVHIPMAVHPRYGEASFDVKLNDLLERKRSLSRDMLAPPVSEGDASELFGQTVGH